MGTCIGYRNIRYFVLFLVFTSTHALITSLISLGYFLVKTSPIFNHIFSRKLDKNSTESESAEEEEI